VRGTRGARQRCTHGGLRECGKHGWVSGSRPCGWECARACGAVYRACQNLVDGPKDGRGRGWARGAARTCLLRAGICAA